MMVGWLDYYGIPFVIALTKADKLPASKMPRFISAAKEHFAGFAHCKEIIPVSSVSGVGKPEVLHCIAAHLD
jgi:GTP-binding protein EngB required for normal cell division